MKYKKWKNEDLIFIKDNFNIMSDVDIAAILNTKNQKITVHMIRRQRRKIGANKKRGRPKKSE